MKSFLKFMGKPPLETMAYKWDIREYKKTNRVKINKEELYRLYIIENKTRAEIAKHFRCGVDVISYRTKEFGVIKSNSKRRRFNFTKNDINNFKNMYQNGDSITKIAKKYNTSRTTIRKYLER